MKPNLFGIVLGTVSLLGVTTPLSAELEAWVVDKERSSIRFAAGLFGSHIRGQFKRFDADIRLDPERLSESRIVVRVDPASIDTRNSERDTELTNTDWFDIDVFPDIVFETERLERTADGYRTIGTLTILDTTQVMTVPFELEVESTNGESVARVRGTTTLSRTKFGLGKGKWGKTSVVRDEVVVEVELHGRYARRE